MKMPRRRADGWRKLGDAALRLMQYAHTLCAGAAVIGFVVGIFTGQFLEALLIMPVGFMANVAFVTLYRRARSDM